MTAAVAHTGTALPGQELHCFVCDVAVTGRYYTLATCRTQSTKVRLIEKLGQLVGERYMVVILEDDIICRGCATLINTLDRLETEMGSVRSVVLGFLEKKYSLEEGELVNSKPTGAPAPPPIITPSTNPPRDHKSDLNRKRKAVSTDGESDGETNTGSDAKKKDKSRMWMQCNKCKYTTDYNAFVVHHVKTHKKKPPSSGDQANQGGMGDADGHAVKRFKTDTDQITDHVISNSNDVQSNDENSLKSLAVDTGDAETVEMIAAEINDFQGSGQSTADGTDMVISSVTQGNTTDGTTSIVMTQQENGQLTATTDNNDEVTIEVSGMVMQSEVEGGAICMMPITDETTGEQIEGADGNVYVHVVDMSGEDVGQVPAGSVGTVGRVNEDGTVEMVEVMWDHMVTDNADGDPDQGQEFTLE